MKHVLFVCDHNAGRKPRKLRREMRLHADGAVTMGCGDACPYVPTTVRARDIPDPAARPPDEVRLAQLLPEMAQEFHALRAPADIRACTDAVLEEYDEAPVRSYVLTLARRRTRECLRAEVCDPTRTAR